MKVQKIAAFSDGDVGGNPAGVAICEVFPEAANMQGIAAQVGFSETAVAVPSGPRWRVRYFSPESEVLFCGHATIALGAALALRHGDGVFALTLNNAEITVEGRRSGDRATLPHAQPVRVGRRLRRPGHGRGDRCVRGLPARHRLAPPGRDRHRAG